MFSAPDRSSRQFFLVALIAFWCLCGNTALGQTRQANAPPPPLESQSISKPLLATQVPALNDKENPPHLKTIGPPVGEYSAEVAVAWFKLQLQLAKETPGFSPPVVSRAFGYAGVTLYEAVVPGMPAYQSLAGQLNGLTAMPQPAAGEEYDWPTVANSALASIIRRLYANTIPRHWAAIDRLETRYNQEFQTRLQPEVFNRSVAHGKSVAEAIYNWSLDDGGHESYWKNFSDRYIPPSGRGLWVPGGSAYSKTLQPDWGNNRPFALSSGSDCAPPPHPTYSEQSGSAFYAEAMEVYTTAKNLTAEQRTIAKFWADNPGQTSTPPGHSISILNQILEKKNATLDMAAEAYAKAGMAVADAFIACWSAKYQYNLLRPLTYINKHIDPNWKPAIITPPFPEYPSGHSVQSAAAAQVMTDLFGAMAFVDHTHDDRGFAPRSFTSFFAAANEAAISRLYGGIHYRAAIELGFNQGKCIGQKISGLQFKRPVSSHQYSVISKKYSATKIQHPASSRSAAKIPLQRDIQYPVSKQRRVLSTLEFQIDLAQKSATVKPSFRTSAMFAEELVQPGTLAEETAAVTNLIRLTTGNFQFDAQNKVFSFDVTLRNISPTRVFVPLQTIIENLRPGPPSITVVNADAGGNGNGAFWDFSNYVGADVELAPNETSRTRNWKFFNPQARQFSFTVRIEGQVTGPQAPVPPTVVQPASPTKQRNIQVRGMTAPQADVEIVGGAARTTTRANANGEFDASVELMPNRVNHLFVTAINFAGRSAPAPVFVIHDAQPPELLVDLPPDSALVIDDAITVLGRVSDVLTGFLGLRVTVNGLPATVAVGNGTNGTFERMGIAMQFGMNTITAVATDTLGNSSTKQIMVERVNPLGRPYITVVSGNNQKAKVNSVAPESLVVKVFKGDGSPFPGKIVTFDVIRSDGDLSDHPNELGGITFQQRTNSQGLARAYWRLGNDAGIGNNRIRAASASVVGVALFCASASPNPAASINVGTGSHQRAEIGTPAPEPLRVYVSDGVNGIANVPVTFTVKNGGMVNGVNQITVRTGITGHAQVNYTLGPDPGNQVIEANFAANTGLPATFDIVAIERGQQPTSLTGIVLDNSNQPIQGATCILQVGAANLPVVRSNATGHFAFAGIPAGAAKLYVDGSTATAVNNVAVPDSSFPALEFEPVVVPGVENKLMMPVLLPPLNPRNAVLYDGTKDVELTTEGIAGLRIRVKKGSVTFSDSTLPSPSKPMRLSFNQVPFGNISMPLPDGASSPFAWTVQPGGAHFNPPAQIIMPNMSGAPPGAVVQFLGFNHDTNRFEIIATGSVTADGQFMVSDPGTGITTAGWGAYCGPCPPQGTGSNADNKPKPGTNDPPTACTTVCVRCKKGNPMDPVYLFSGEFYEEAEDLRIKGRGMDFIWARKYRSQIGPNTAQGNGWDFSYNISVQEEGESVRLGDGNTRTDVYLPETDSTWTRGEQFRQFKKGPDSTYGLTFEDRGQWQFNPLNGRPAQGKIARIVDRNGNRITFHYDAQGRLSRIRETLDRDILIAYNADGFISTVTDFAGRMVRYTYYSRNETGGSFGDLKSVTTPVLTGTPNNNDFPNGKTTSYTYSTGFANARLNHNLLTITDGRRNTYLANVYAAATDSNDINFDRIVRQIWGGDTLDVTYVRQRPSLQNNKAVMKTILNDRAGNVKEYFYDVRNRGVLMREYTGRANPTLPTTETANRPTGKLRPNDPNFFETRYEYNFDGMQTRIILPNGNITENVYESEMNPNATARARGNLRATRRLPGAHPTVGDQAIIAERFEYDTDLAGCCGFNFVTKHVDARRDSTLHKYDEAGNRIHTQHRIPTIVEDFEYNEFGQMTARVWPDNGSNHHRRDVFTYYGAGPQRGYLRAEVVDSANFALTTINEYDRVGNIVRIIDPRGHDTQFVVNALDQVVRDISREVTLGNNKRVRYLQDTHYDANDNIVRRDIQNIDDRGNVVATNPFFTTTYEYEILNNAIRITREVDPQNNIVTEYAYDNNRNRTLIRYGEATSGRQLTNVIRTLYDERDLVFREIRAASDPQQSTTQYDYDRNGNLIARRHGLEDVPHVTTSVYDGYNRLVSSTDPMGNVMVLNYDENGNRKRSRIRGELIDVAGGAKNVLLDSTNYVYDPMDRLTSTEVAFFDTDTRTPIDDGKAITQMVYNANSQIIRVVDDNNHARRISYDTANRQSITTDAKNDTVIYAYDANSNVISLTEIEKSDLGKPNEIFVTTSVYDNLDRAIKTTDNIGNINEYSYDSRNNRTLHSDALRSSPTTAGNRTRMDYDGLNRLIRTARYLTNNGSGSGAVIDSIVTTQAWDHTSRLIAQTDDNSNTTAYAYDALNRKTATTYADGTLHTMVYDVHDNPTTMTDANGSVAKCTYDFGDRLIRKAIARGAGVQGDTLETYQYDGRSRLILAKDNDSEVTRSYNSLSQVTRETLNGQTTTSIYDGAGNMRSCTYPGGRKIVTTYDELDRKKGIFDQIGQNFNQLADYKYIGPYRIERRDYNRNRTHTIYQYDGAKRMIGTRHTFVPAQGTPTIFDKREYTWDQMYNKTSRRDSLTGVTHNYAYDSIYRLAQSRKDVPGNPSSTIGYAFDGVGNRTVVTGDSDPGTYFMSQQRPEPADFQMNQYTTTPFDTRLNDRNGNLQRLNNGLPSQRDFVYDYRNQMIEFREAATGTTARYAYDALSRRIAKVVTIGVTSVTTRFFYDDWQEIEEQNENGVTQASYVYGLYIDEVLNMQRDVDRNGNAEDYYYHTDDLYNVMAVTNSSGGVVERYEYSDYGQPEFFNTLGNRITQSVVQNPLLFTGRRYDPEIDLYYSRARYLSPQAGRFISRDRIGIWSDIVNVGNGYSYVGNNPAVLTDPSGLAIWVCLRGAQLGPTPFTHAYFYNDHNGDNCGFGLPAPTNEDSENWNVEGTVCWKVQGSENRENEIIQCCRHDTRNSTWKWRPLYNDCHNILQRCLNLLELPNPVSPWQRFGPRFLRDIWCNEPGVHCAPRPPSSPPPPCHGWGCLDNR